MKYFCYFLECSDSNFYCGWTVNLEKRLGCHNRGKGSRYTRSRLPVKMVYYEEYPDRSSAMRRERKLKKFTRCRKRKLIQGFSHDQHPDSD